MGESKRDKIARLEAERAELAPYLEQAQTIKSRVIGRVSAMGVEDLEAAFVQEIASTEEKLVHEGIWERIGQLSASTVLEWYVEHVGSEEVDMLMRKRAQIETAVLTNNMHVLEMKRFGDTYGSIDTSMSKPNDHLVVGFSYGTHKFFEYIDLRCMPHEGEAGKLFEILRVPENDFNYSIRNWKAHAVVNIGGACLPKEEMLDPVVALNSPLALWLFDEDGDRMDYPESTNSPVSYITVNNIPVLGTPPPGR